MSDFPRFQKKFLGIFKGVFDKRTLKRMGDVIIKNIQDRTAKSQTIARGKVERLKPLADSTKRQKRRDGKSTRSRLRDTGELIERGLRSVPRRNVVVVEPKGARNKEVGGFVTEQGRPFIPEDGLDKKTEGEVVDIITKRLNKLIRSR